MGQNCNRKYESNTRALPNLRILFRYSLAKLSHEKNGDNVSSRLAITNLSPFLLYLILYTDTMTVTVLEVAASLNVKNQFIKFTRM